MMAIIVSAFLQAMTSGLMIGSKPMRQAELR
jgi:hypothetical protein